MTKPSIFARRLFAAAVLLVAIPFAQAADEHGVHFEAAGTDINNQASLQRGAALFMNYCSGCHSLKYQRYSRLAEDLGLSEEQVEQNLNFAGVQLGEVINTGVAVDQGNAWFGKAPPDLSLSARERGVDWIYAYLKSFYIDETRPVGWNNSVFPGASMPNPLWELQGVQRAHMNEEGHVEGLELVQEGRLSEREFNQVARDITAFLEYVGEPAALKRSSLGLWVLFFLLVLTGLTYLLKKEFWKDVH
ncbi:cytochrome c1 [Coralloluteibacterium stylophorae]|uniref:Cytochrome c1 n=1 Tax=Coralloluteibacterium stylophorae TaxID=1776034 RepID=A0A8J8AZ18_9GAMM|nr:cytochrome c1 [Coralloluteibacterium stylophorae]MBS7456678.1 cytochrome c1 [Coralloluteibacterium stylophorae]